ncbi:MAG: asparagine synthase (glutamine-hydrolyzing) [Nitrospiraceae bacterium]
MCGIVGAIALDSEPIAELGKRLAVMGELVRHRGPDGDGTWMHPRRFAGFGHRRLSIIDLQTGQQPMRDAGGNCIAYNGEIYNYLELKNELTERSFRTHSDTEVILQAYRQWGRECVLRFRGMFAFALWDEEQGALFCARDRFGIKPFYYCVADGVLYFASEAKALLPFVADIATDLESFREYLSFQFCLGGKTLFRGIRELPAGHVLTVHNGTVRESRYWEVYYHPDFDHTETFFEDRIRALLDESVSLHLRGDVSVGAYISGGLDSSIVASVASRQQGAGFMGFTGKFANGEAYDESRYARDVARANGFELLEAEIVDRDFVDEIQNVIYHLDFPTAGPGSFPQYMVSRLASRHRKAVLGGQGGDEIFGGYARYLIAYFEQCIKAAIDGTMHSGSFVVTYESIIPNLPVLRNYKPLLQEFWKEGLFQDLDRRYFRLINRAPDLGEEINWMLLSQYSPYDTFCQVFQGKNVRKESYFDRMTHFDFKTLLPALLHVEDRVSMAHGLESRVPLLDHPLVELAATMPSNIKFKDGRLKHVLKNAMAHVLPDSVVQRKDKMGFPVPLQEWIRERGPVRDFVFDVLSCSQALSRDLVDNRLVVQEIGSESKFGRKLWGLLCLEMWQQRFHDRAAEFRQLLTAEVPS